jgi:hypothetical protein
VSGERPRITVWWCDKCGYWRQEQSSGVHQTSNPAEWRGPMVVHELRPVIFEQVPASSGGTDDRSGG